MVRNHFRHLVNLGLQRHLLSFVLLHLTQNRIFLVSLRGIIVSMIVLQYLRDAPQGQVSRIEQQESRAHTSKSSFQGISASG